MVSFQRGVITKIPIPTVLDIKNIFLSQMYIYTHANASANTHARIQTAEKQYKSLSIKEYLMSNDICICSF